jgi:hypothetical protein
MIVMLQMGIIRCNGFSGRRRTLHWSLFVNPREFSNNWSFPERRVALSTMFTYGTYYRAFPDVIYCPSFTDGG